MATLDWIIVGIYILTAIMVGVYFTKRAAKSTADFFVAGRSLHWFIAGTSIVATTFSCDTPLFVAGMSRSQGVSSNWFWWSAAIGQIASVFFFAKLWRRTEVLTDLEFIALRYEKTRLTKGFRIFHVFFSGVYFNSVIMASVTLAMVKIVKVVLHLSDKALFTMPVFGDVTSTGLVLIILGSAAVLYSILSGLYGVVYTDFIQFGLAMFGSIALAVIVYTHAAGGEGGLIANLNATPGFKPALLNFFPDLSTFDLKSFSFIIYMTVLWWGGVVGGGYHVQRLLATRSEKDSLFAFLWYNFCHYVLRPWPWIIVGMVSLIYFPDLADSESAFPRMIDEFLPVGLKGVIVASLLAAFMSTLDTHLNWGASYLINDFYQPYVAPNKSPRHYVNAARIAMVFITIITVLVSTRLTGILDTYKYLGVLFAGCGTITIAKWYWWRVTPLSEISGLMTSLFMGNMLVFYWMPDVKIDGELVVDAFAVRVVINIIVTAIVWVSVTLLTSKEPGAQAIAFYKKMRLGGPGWRKIAELTGIPPHKGELKNNFIAWLSCVVAMFSLLLALGKFLFHEWVTGIVYLLVMLVSGLILKDRMKKISFLG